MAKTKYPKKFQTKKTAPEPQAQQTNNTTETMEENTEQPINTESKPTLEPTLEMGSDMLQNPHAQPKIHRDYNTEGIRPGERTESKKQSDVGHEQFRDSMKPSSEAPPVADDEFTPTPPEADAAPEHEIKDGPAGPEGEPFSIPSGTAEELIESGAKALNYLIENFGDVLVGIKIPKEFAILKSSTIVKIKDSNKRNVEAIKLSPTEVQMLKKPLVKIMQEKGIRGLTPGEELLMVAVVIVAGKVKVVMQIRAENKILLQSILDEIKKLHTSGNSGLGDDDIPLSETEDLEDKMAA